MKGLRYAVCFLMLIGILNIAMAADRSAFRFKAPITGNGEADVPIRLALPLEVIAETSDSFSDVRLFDDLGMEVPYVIYTQIQPEGTIQSFGWTVIDYQNTDGAQTIFMKCLTQGGAFNAITLNTSARDFHKDVAVYASDDRRSWKLITTDTVFDFSSHIDLRKTTLELQEMNTRYLKIVMKDRSKVIEQGEDIRLRYKDLEFTLSGLTTGEIKIDGFTSHLSSTSPEKPLFDHTVSPNPTTFLDKNGNTIISLGRVNLPIERVSLKIKNTYYYRTIELWIAETDEEKSYSRVVQDVVYRIPGVSEVKTALSFNQPQHVYVRLKVINHDNPLLQVHEVKVEWLRRNLFLIPEAGRRYTLYCGGKDIRPPQYELHKLIPNQHEQLVRYASWTIGTLQMNEGYVPPVDARSTARLERYLLTGLVILLACGMAYWTFLLLKKIPERR